MRKFVIAVCCYLLLAGCSEEQQNQLSRLGVTWLEGEYRITYADGNHVKSWVVRDGKVTSEPAKGYYYFWATDGKGTYYVQTPIERTYIEEIKD
jgi:major membrane immunogen (membrane-anchored lipoprotein)